MPSLRGSKPKERKARLKALMFGPAGVGKTVAAIQMPRPYVIDTEGGSVHYGDTITAKGGVVFSTNDIEEVIAEVRALATEKHGYLTLVIDPFTPLYDTKLEEGEGKVGSDFGRHYGYANKACKRLFNLLSQLDLNVIVTCHSKNEYGDGMKVIGHTFDGWKKLDYLFDLVFELQRRGNKRVALVRKTRLEAFPDQDNFEWSYDALADRYGRDRLEADVQVVTFASPQQVAELGRLLEVVKVADDWLDKCLSKAGVDEPEDLTGEQISKMIDSLSAKLNATPAATDTKPTRSRSRGNGSTQQPDAEAGTVADVALSHSLTNAAF